MWLEVESRRQRDQKEVRTLDSHLTEKAAWLKPLESHVVEKQALMEPPCSEETVEV